MSWPTAPCIFRCCSCVLPMPLAWPYVKYYVFTDSHNKASVLNLVYIKFDNQVCLHYSRSKQDRMLGMHLKIKARIPEAFLLSKVNSPNVSTTPITAMGCRQCLPLSVVQLEGKHCRKLHSRNEVVDTFEHSICGSIRKKLG